MKRLWRWLMATLFPPLTCARCQSQRVNGYLAHVHRGILGEWRYVCLTCEHRWREFC